MFRKQAVELGVLHGDGSLISKAAQDGPVVGREDARVTTKDEDQTNHLATGHQRQGNTGEQPQAAQGNDLVEQVIELRRVAAGGIGCKGGKIV